MPSKYRAFKEAADRIVELERDLAAAQEWREAVLNELIVAHIYTKEHDTNPRKAIQDAINWNCQIALDPAVSSDARKLIAAAREARQRAEALAERRLAEAQALVKDHATILDALERAEALAEQNAKDAKEAIAIAGFLFDAWEDGTPCFETDGESGMGASIGNAFKLSNEDFTRCTEFLNRVDPRGAAIDAARSQP